MNRKKLEELVLYIAEKSKTDPAFGLTKLNKILFAADFYYYGIKGQSITEAVYMHLDQGPVPKNMREVLESLQATGRAKIEQSTYFGYSQEKVIGRKGPDLSDLSEDELTFVDHIIQTLRPYNATQLSRWTHTLNPWLLTGRKEEIPYYTVFVMEDFPVEKAAVDWAKIELERLREDESYQF